jgi:hypothetical protein
MIGKGEQQLFDLSPFFACAIRKRRTKQKKCII